MTPISIAAYLLLFVGAGFAVVFACLLIGWFLRPRAVRPEKREIYECGEVPVGSGFVQFDLRFYVVALLFLVFEVEVGFFFPWATVFGRASQLSDPKLPKVVSPERAARTGETVGALTPEASNQIRQLGVVQPIATRDSTPAAIEESARKLARMAMGDVAVFFGVVLVGFAYVWKRGDLNWVRAVGPRAAPGTATTGRGVAG